MSSWEFCDRPSRPLNEHDEEEMKESCHKKKENTKHRPRRGRGKGFVCFIVSA